MRLALVCFYCLCVFVYVFYFIATMSFAGYFLPVLFCLLSMLISDSRFDLVWFRLSCDHGWIRSGSVNVRKQQQQPMYSTLATAVLSTSYVLSTYYVFFCCTACTRRLEENIIYCCSRNLVCTLNIPLLPVHTTVSTAVLSTSYVLST